MTAITVAGIESKERAEYCAALTALAPANQITEARATAAALWDAVDAKMKEI